MIILNAMLKSDHDYAVQQYTVQLYTSEQAEDGCI